MLHEKSVELNSGMNKNLQRLYFLDADGLWIPISIIAFYMQNRIFLRFVMTQNYNDQH